MKKSTWVLVISLLGHFFANGQETLSQQKNEQLYQSGLDLLSHREYGAAYKTFDDFIRINPNPDARRTEAEYYKGFSALSLYHSDGEKLLEEFVREHPKSARAAIAYYDMADFFYAEKNYSKASEYFARVDFPALGIEQQNSGRFHWGYSLFALRSFPMALDEFNTMKTQGGSYGPAASYYAGFIESSAGDYANALIDLKRAEMNESYATIVPVLIATVYYKQRDYNELLAYSEAALQRENISSSDEISLLAAEAHFRKADYAKALSRYAEYIDEHPRNADRGVLYRAGIAAFSMEDNDQALGYLKAAASDIDSVGVYASYYAGLIYLKRNEKPLALTAFEVARNYRKEPRMAEESLFQSAKIRYELGNPDIAINEFELLLKDYPATQHGQEVRELLSQAYVNANNYNKAIEYIEKLPNHTLAVDRAYQKATYLKGTELFNKEEFAAAVQYFEKSMQYPIDPEILAEASYWCAETYSIGRKFEQAIPLYEQSLGQSSANSVLVKDTRYGLGYARYNLQQYDKALISFKDFIARTSNTDPNYNDGLIRVADCLYVGKSYPDALSHYRKAILLNTVDADYAHLQVGIILAIQHKYKEASGEFDLVLTKTDSRYADDALFQRAQIDFEESNYAAAVTGYTRLISTSKSSRLLPYAYTRRAASYFNLRNYDLTANDYIAVFDKFPAHPVAQDLLLPLQESLNLANRSSEFDHYLTLFKQANPDAKGIELVEFETAKNLYFSQNYEKAIDYLSRYSTSYPESPRLSEALYYEAESYYRLKNINRALELYYQLVQDGTFAYLSRVAGRIAEIEFKSGRYDKAVVASHQLARLATNKKEEHAAWNGLMDSYYLLAQYDSADSYARKIIEQGSIQPSAQNKASLYLGKTAMARGDYETAKDEFLNTLNAARDEYGAEAKYLLAEIFYLTKESKQCAETLFALNSDFSAYDEWVGRSYLLLADNYLATGEIFQAKGTLKSLIDNFPLQNIRDLAKEKLKGIEQDEMKKQAAEKLDTTDNRK